MKSLATCLNRMISEGYTEDFKITEQGLESLHKHNNYKPEQIEVVNFFRFEGDSDPADNSILYAIETTDGTKGTLTDAFGPYADAGVTKFMKELEDIAKKTGKNDTSANG